MRILKRQFACAVAFGLAGIGQVALADNAPAPTPTTSSDEETCDPPASCAAPTPAPAPAPQAYVAPAPPPPAHHYVAHEQTWIERYGLGFSVGGGLDDFVGSTARNETSLGGGWSARATVGTRSYVAFEVSYIGSANSINALGLQSDAVLVGNGAQAALRVNILPHFLAQPFIYGGAAWRHYNISNSSINTSDVANTDDVAEFPAGVGFAGYLGGFMADVRGEYRFTTANDLMPSQTTPGQEASLDRWGVSANLGFEY